MIRVEGNKLHFGVKTVFGITTLIAEKQGEKIVFALNTPIFNKEVEAKTEEIKKELQVISQWLNCQ